MENNEMNLSHVMKEKIKKAQSMMEEGMDIYGRFFDKKDSISEILEYDENSNKEFKTAGRIVSYRRMGKNGFGHIQDMTGKIQFYVKADLVGEELYELFKKLSTGDIIGLTGKLFLTKTGELTLKVDNLELLSKNVRPLPEKFHGLTDVDMRYRQRYIDLVMNEDVMETMKKRFEIIRFIRNYLEDKGFVEVETPMLHPILGGANAKPFKTHHNSLDMPMYLRIAPELYLKRLLVGGFEKVFEINRNFRNEGLSVRHNPEFTMMELYQSYADYNTMMELTEDMLSKATKHICKTLNIKYGEYEIDMTAPFKKVAMEDIVKEVTSFDIKNTTDEEAVKFAENLGIKLENKNISKYAVLNILFEEKVEHTLINPTFITKYPKEISPLAKETKEDKNFVDRFELFIGGREYGNAYSELNDPFEQKERFKDQVEKKNAGDEEASEMDLDYVRALEYAMPPAGGLGIGIDRLVMLLTNSASIKDVILFPTLKKETNFE